MAGNPLVSIKEAGSNARQQSDKDECVILEHGLSHHTNYVTIISAIAAALDG
jgi:hypothetical protein